MTDWIYLSGNNDKPFILEEHSGYYGFVYLIENLVNGRKYIGKKFFYRRKILPVTKTRKRRKRLLVESDWKDYYGSSDELFKDIEEHGTHKFKRTILHLCKNKAECAYLEAYEQFVRGVLLSDDYYNGWISIKVRGSHLKGIDTMDKTNLTETEDKTQ